MYKNGFGINNLGLLMCHKTKSNQTKQNKTKTVPRDDPLEVGEKKNVT